MRRPLADRSFDVYLCVSVIEHRRFREEIIGEAAGVLRPGELLVMAFDLLEEKMSMAYPKEFGPPQSLSKIGESFEKMNSLEMLEERSSSWIV